MTTSIRSCEVCEQRFVVTPEHKLTCSTKCRLDLAARRTRPRNLIAWSMGPMPVGPQPPNRVREALAETRASVEQLQAEGRRLARAS